MHVNVLLVAWQRLEEQLASARDLEELIRAHDKYLSHLREGWLLSTAQDSGDVYVRAVFDSILKLSELVNANKTDADSVVPVYCAFESARENLAQRVSILNSRAGRVDFEPLLLQLDFNRFYIRQEPTHHTKQPT